MSAPIQSDAAAFYQFLGEQLCLGPPSQTPEQLLETWRRQREYDETVAAVKAGLRDMEAGRMTPLRDMLQEIDDRSEAGRS